MAIHMQIYERLKEVARKGDDLITYGGIAPLANLNMENPDDRNKIAHILGEISTHEYSEGRPLLSAIVVLAGIGYPGVGVHHGRKEFEDLEFFAQEVRRVYDYWKIH
jgi:hypothetical protein